MHLQQRLGNCVTVREGKQPNLYGHGKVILVHPLLQSGEAISGRGLSLHPGAYDIGSNNSRYCGVHTGTLLVYPK